MDVFFAYVDVGGKLGYRNYLLSFHLPNFKFICFLDDFDVDKVKLHPRNMKVKDFVECKYSKTSRLSQVKEKERTKLLWFR